MEDVKKMSESSGKDFLALVTWAFQVSGFYPQHEFYLKMGFKRVREDDPFLLYYPPVSYTHLTLPTICSV